MKPSYALRESLVVSGQAAETQSPSKRAFDHECKIWSAERPFFIGNIAWISNPTTALLELFCCHPKLNARM